MTDRQLMQQALRELEGIPFYKKYGVRISNAITALRNRLAHCDRCGKKMGGEGDIHTCTPDPIGDAQDRLIAELAAQPAQQEPYGWVQPNPSFNSGIFNQGAECPSGWVGSAIDVYTTPPAAAPVQQEPVAEVVWGAKTDFEWKFKMLAELACVEDVPVKLYAGPFKGAAMYWHDTETDKGTTPPAAQPTMFGPMGTVGALFDKHVIGGLDKNWRVYVEKR
jgi:hypothetical protein